MKTLIALFEKVVWTYLQAFLTVWTLGPLDASTGQAAAIASIPAALTVVMNSLPAAPADLPFGADVIWRTGRTYVAGFLGFLVAVPVFRLDYSIAVAASAAAMPAALAVAKGLIASKIGSSDSAATLPASMDPASEPPPPSGSDTVHLTAA